MSAPRPYFDDGQVTLYLGDCLDVLGALPDASIDAVITDPPYGLEFMGREWDTFRPPNARIRERVDGRTNPAEGKSVTRTPEAYVAGQAFGDWCEAWAGECLRVLKPGGYLAAFGGTRTYHWLACGIELAGFEIRDSLHWLYGSGFPKGGACLKPAHEPIVLARKPARKSAPLPGLDGCRVTSAGSAGLAVTEGKNRDSDFGGGPRDNHVFGADERTRAAGGNYDGTAGRWPPNVLLGHAEECTPAGTRLVAGNQRSNPTVQAARANVAKGAERERLRGPRGVGNADGTETVEAWDCVPGCPVAELDRQGGATGSSGGNDIASRRTALGGSVYGDYSHDTLGQHAGGLGDTGGASRFFPVFRYEAKAPASERPRLADGTAHPTVKPLALMRWLVRLVTPPSVDVLACSECEQDLRGVRPAVQTEASRADHVRSGMSAEAGGAVTEGAHEPLSDVRQNASGRPGEEVLQPGVPGGSTAQAEDLHHLRGRVFATPADASDVLTAVRSEGGNAPAGGPRDVRRDVPAGFEQQAFLLSGLRVEVDGAREAEGRPADGPGLHHALHAGSPDVQQAGLHPGAPQGDGRRAGSHSPAVRGGAPQERDQGRQDPQARAQADRMPALPRDDRRFGSCPSCGGALAPAKRPGLVLDPFAGSGTTGEACVIEGFNCILAEKDPASAELVKARLSKPIQPVMFGEPT